MKKLKRLTLTSLCSAALLLGTQPVFGLGLGRINLESYLNQPLNAHVAINALGDVDPSEIKVQLADRKAFEKAGIERPYYLTQLEFHVVNKDGKPYIKITSFDPVLDPFLSFVVEAKWASGRVLREYTLLLDPMETSIKQNFASKPTLKPVFSPKKTADKPKAKSSAKPKIAPKQAPRASTSNKVLNAGQTYGPVKPEDTLWDLASRLAGQTNADVYQSMLAIVEKNPRAFIRQNVHGLRNGVTLEMPSKDEIFQMSVSEAIAKVAEHETAWKEKRTVEPSNKQKAKSKTQAKAKSTPKLNPVAQKPLKLVMPTKPTNVASLKKPEQVPFPSMAKPVTKQAASNKEAFQDRLLMIEETLDTLKRTNQTLKENQKSLEDKNKDLLNLLAKKDEEIQLLRKDMQQSVAQVQENPQPESLKKATVEITQAATSTSTSPAQGIKTATNGKVSPQKMKLDAIKAKAEKTSLNAAPVVNSAPATSPAPVVTPAPVVASPAQSVSETQSNSWWLMILSVFGFAGAGAVGFEYLRRRRPEVLAKYFHHDLFTKFVNKEDTVESPIKVRTQVLNEGGVSTPDDIKDAFSVFEDEEIETKSKAKMKPQPQVQHQVQHQTQPASTAVTSEDVLADAEVYMAYERFDQAEEVLKHYVHQHPNDGQGHLKLMELYQQTERFDQLKEHLMQLPPDLASSDPQAWSSIQALLEKCAPKPAPEPTSFQQEPPKVTSAQNVMSQPQQDDHIDEDDTTQVDYMVQQAPQEQPTPTFEPEPIQAFPRTSDNQGGGLNLADKCGVASEQKFELEGNQSSQSPKPAEDQNQNLPDDYANKSSSDMSFEGETAQSFGYLEDEDEVETKYALALAYLDLDDYELAKEHVVYVLNHGDDAQKAKAQELLDKFPDEFK